MSETPEQDSFFQNLLTKDIQAKAKEIQDNSLVYYDKSIFLKFNICFTRYLKNINDMNEYDMADFIGKYFNSCLITKNYNQCSDDINILSKRYFMFDNNCYLFLLKFFAGEFDEACNLILTVSSNVPEAIFQYISEEDFAFYFCLCILINYHEGLYREILIQNNIYVYKLIEKFPKIFEILEFYSKCQFEKVSSLYEKTFKEKINSNNELVNYEKKINKIIKFNILKEILSLSSEIKLSDLIKMLNIESIPKAKDYIIQLIELNNFPVKIDDINEIVYYNKKKSLDNILSKTLNKSKKNLAKVFDFTLKQALKGKNKLSQNEQNVKQIQIKDESDERELNYEQFMNEEHYYNMLNK